VLRWEQSAFWRGCACLWERSDLWYRCFLAGSACLSRRPLWFRPVGNPYLIIPVLLPRGSKLEIRALLPPTEGQQPDQWKTTHLEQGRPELVHTIAFEVGIVSSTTGGPWSSPLQCGETTGEDILVAFVY